MLSINRIIDQFKRQYMIFVNVQRTYEDNKIFVLQIHLKFIESRYDVQFEQELTIDNFNQNFFNEKNKIIIAFDYDVQFLIIDT